MSDAPSHLDLVARARAVRQAVISGDADAVHAELSRLRTALVRHLHAEQVQLTALRQTTAHVTRTGQQRLLNDLLSSTENDDGTCNCLVRAAEVQLLLRRRAKLESAVLGRGDDPNTHGR